jgi:hypothetical protein
MRRECRREDVFTTEEAMEQVLVRRRIEAMVRADVRRLASQIREEQR